MIHFKGDCMKQKILGFMLFLCFLVTLSSPSFCLAAENPEVTTESFSDRANQAETDKKQTSAMSPARIFYFLTICGAVGYFYWQRKQAKKATQQSAIEQTAVSPAPPNEHDETNRNNTT